MTINSTARLNNLTPFRRPRHAAERETAWSGGQDTPARGNRASLVRLRCVKRRLPQSVSSLRKSKIGRRRQAKSTTDRTPGEVRILLRTV